MAPLPHNSVQPKGIGRGYHNGIFATRRISGLITSQLNDAYKQADPERLAHGGDVIDRDPLEPPQPSKHYWELAWATFQTILYITTFAFDIELLVLFYDSSTHQESGAGIVCIFFFNGLTSAFMDWASTGRFWVTPLDFLQMRPVVDYAYFVREWHAHLDKPWDDNIFRYHQRYNTFPQYLPSLIVQVHAFMVIDDKRVLDESVQYPAFLLTSLSALLSLHFFYLYLDSTVVKPMMSFFLWIKGVFNTALRSCLIAYIIDELHGMAFLFIIPSYLLGILSYYLVIRKIQKDQADVSDYRQDNPLHSHKIIQLVFAHQVASTALFGAFPFSPSRAALHWWWGYMFIELKLMAENALMFMIVLWLEWDDHETTVVGSVAVFGAMMFIANLLIVSIMSNSIKQFIHERGVYTTVSIVDLFAMMFVHLKRKIEGISEDKLAEEEEDMEKLYATHDMNRGDD